jgi:RNA polymerase sigma-70 factor (ECF subfamily)
MSGVGRQALVEHYFRHESGRLVATLARRFGVGRLQLIEDAVQTALLTALTAWNLSGVPREPAAWLLQVARNRVLDELRREKAAGRAVDGHRPRLDDADTSAVEGGPVFVDEIQDDLLRMLFICCDEALPRE